MPEHSKTGGSQLRQSAERTGVLPLRGGRCHRIAQPAHGVEQPHLGSFAQLQHVHLRGRRGVRLAQDVGDALVRCGETARLGQLEERAERLQARIEVQG